MGIVDVASRAVSVFAIVALFVAACGGEPDSTKYVQTWETAYAETTCAEWHEAMTAHERFVMAADILFTLHQREQPDVGIPSDILISRFETGIGGSCAGAGESLGVKVMEVAASLYTVSNDLGPGSE